MPLTLSNSVNYSTEGTPMLIADGASARHWTGRNYDGSGVIIEYGGRGVDKLPKEFAQTKKPTGPALSPLTQPLGRWYSAKS